MATFIDVLVDEHDAIPDGCCLRFRAQADPIVVARIRWESEGGTGGLWDVVGRTAEDEPTPALARPVDDSSAGTSILVVGGARGLRLTSVDTAETVAEPYLLVSREALVTD